MLGAAPILLECSFLAFPSARLTATLFLGCGVAGFASGGRLLFFGLFLILFFGLFLFLLRLFWLYFIFSLARVLIALSTHLVWSKPVIGVGLFFFGRFLFFLFLIFYNWRGRRWGRNDRRN